MKKDGIRERIDEIDLGLLALLEERMELGLRVRRFKSGLTDENRERVVLNRAMRSSLALVEADVRLARTHTILVSVPGIGSVSACAMIAGLPAPGSTCAPSSATVIRYASSSCPSFRYCSCLPCLTLYSGGWAI